MKKMLEAFRVSGTVCAVVLLIVGCASIPPAQQEDRVDALIAFMNEAEAEGLLEQSGRPFLLDSEIIESANDLYIMWRNMFAAGFHLPGAQVQSIDVVDGDTHLRYGDNLEMRTYFERRVPEGATVVRVRTRQATYDLILGGERGGLPMIYGIRGPV